MNVLFDLSKPENRRNRRPEAVEKRLAEIPAEFLPRCSICNEIIPYTEDVINNTKLQRYMERNCCSVYTDKKEVQCRTLKIQQNNAKRPKKPESERKAPAKPGAQLFKKFEEPKREKMSQEEADRLDEEQAQINIAIHKRIMERCGYVSSPGRSLSPEEIEAIRHTITPVNTEKVIDKHYRPLVKRGHAHY